MKVKLRDYNAEIQYSILDNTILYFDERLVQAFYIGDEIVPFTSPIIYEILLYIVLQENTVICINFERSEDRKRFLKVIFNEDK